MVKDNFNQYYTNLLRFLQDKYKDLKGSTKKMDKPPYFPHMYFKQIGGETALKTLSGTEDGINLGIEIKIYSNRTSSEARKIANSAREYMIGNGFNCDYFSSVDNVSDSSIDQFLLRFSKLDT